jgi:hypothetical protein
MDFAHKSANSGSRKLSEFRCKVMRSSRGWALAFVLFVGVWPATAEGQRVSRSRLLIVNIALGAGTAGIAELSAGHSFWRGLLKGRSRGHRSVCGEVSRCATVSPHGLDWQWCRWCG